MYDLGVSVIFFTPNIDKLLGQFKRTQVKLRKAQEHFEAEAAVHDECIEFHARRAAEHRASAERAKAIHMNISKLIEA